MSILTFPLINPGRVMKKLLLLAVAVGVLYMYKPGLFPSFSKSGAYDSNGKPQVLLFTATSCNGYCAKARQELTDRNIDFTELKLDGNDENTNRFHKLGGNGMIPLLVAGSLSVPGYDRGMYASVLAQNFGDKALTQTEQSYYSRHFKADGTPTIYMYGATWCGFCTVMRNEMEKRKIDFDEIDVDTAADSREVEDAMDLAALPVTYVGYKRIVGAESVDPVLAALKSGVRHM
jgi:glutaredoxin